MSFNGERLVFNYTLPDEYYAQAQPRSHTLHPQGSFYPGHGSLSNVHRTGPGGIYVDPRQLTRSFSSPQHSMEYVSSMRTGSMNHNKRANTMDQESRKRHDLVVLHGSLKHEPPYATDGYLASYRPRSGHGSGMTCSLPTPPLSPSSQSPIANEPYPTLFTPGTTTTTGPRSYCTHPNCTDPDTGKSLKSFSRPADLVRHEKSIHAIVPTKFDCPRPRCNRKGENGFTRADHLIEHRRGYHGEAIPRRRTGSSGDRNGTTRRR